MKRILSIALAMFILSATLYRCTDSGEVEIQNPQPTSTQMPTFESLGLEDFDPHNPATLEDFLNQFGPTVSEDVRLALNTGYFDSNSRSSGTMTWENVDLDSIELFENERARGYHFEMLQVFEDTTSSYESVEEIIAKLESIKNVMSTDSVLDQGDLDILIIQHRMIVDNLSYTISLMDEYFVEDIAGSRVTGRFKRILRRVGSALNGAVRGGLSVGLLTEMNPVTFIAGAAVGLIGNIVRQARCNECTTAFSNLCKSNIYNCSTKSCVPVEETCQKILWRVSQ